MPEVDATAPSSAPRVHASRVDAWLVAVSLPALYFMLVHPIRGHLAGDAQWPLWLAALLWGVTAGLVAVSWPLRYVIDADALHIRMGVVRWRIPLAQIQSVAPSRALWRAPALSLRRLRIDYLAPGGVAQVYISPRDRQGFLEDLAARAPSLTRKGAGLACR